MLLLAVAAAVAALALALAALAALALALAALAALRRRAGGGGDLCDLVRRAAGNWQFGGGPPGRACGTRRVAFLVQPCGQWSWLFVGLNCLRFIRSNY